MWCFGLNRVLIISDEVELITEGDSWVEMKSQLQTTQGENIEMNQEDKPYSTHFKPVVLKSGP